VGRKRKEKTTFLKRNDETRTGLAANHGKRRFVNKKNFKTLQRDQDGRALGGREGPLLVSEYGLHETTLEEKPRQTMTFRQGRVVWGRNNCCRVDCLVWNMKQKQKVRVSSGTAKTLVERGSWEGGKLLAGDRPTL